MSEVPMKRCTKCGEIKPFTREYFKFLKNEGTRQPCKKCDSRINGERKLARLGRGRIRQPSQSLEHKRCTRCGKLLKNTGENFVLNAKKETSQPCRDCHKRLAKEFREANPDHMKRLRQNSYKRNKDKIRARTKAYRLKNPEISRQIVREWRKKHPEYDREHRPNRHLTPQHKAASQQHRARKRGLPDNFTSRDWEHALVYFGGCCAVCGRHPGLWHTLAADHWIPLKSPDCLGTIRKNIVPLCHGVGGCNNSKHDRPAEEWLIDKFGKRKAKQIIQRIQAYFDSLPD